MPRFVVSMVLVDAFGPRVLVLAGQRVVHVCVLHVRRHEFALFVFELDRLAHVALVHVLDGLLAEIEVPGLLLVSRVDLSPGGFLLPGLLFLGVVSVVAGTRILVDVDGLFGVEADVGRLGTGFAFDAGGVGVELRGLGGVKVRVRVLGQKGVGDAGQFLRAVGVDVVDVDVDVVLALVVELVDVDVDHVVGGAVDARVGGGREGRGLRPLLQRVLQAVFLVGARGLLVRALEVPARRVLVERAEHCVAVLIVVLRVAQRRAVVLGVDREVGLVPDFVFRLGKLGWLVSVPQVFQFTVTQVDGFFCW